MWKERRREREDGEEQKEKGCHPTDHSGPWMGLGVEVDGGMVVVADKSTVKVGGW